LNERNAAGEYGCVTLSEAARIVKPAVSRVAVFRWIRTGKLRAFREKAAGRYLITFTHLRQFANDHGKDWAPPEPKHR
jgi:hypothetical protein